MLIKYKFKINGTHCSSCKHLIETEIDTMLGVKDINVNHKSGITNIEYDDEKISKEKIFEAIKRLKYEPVEYSEEDKKSGIKKVIVIAVVFILFLVAYYIVSELGLLELMASLNEKSISLWLILLIGFLASFHCVGMCGGLVISYTAKVKKAEGTKSYLAHVYYNLGRFISYSLIGGILGGFGSFFGVNPSFTGALVLVAGIFMILLGASLISSVSWIEKIKLKTPKFIARFLYNNQKSEKPKGPFIIGLLNGFMPCGPLQAMQVYALTTGSIVGGGVAMGVYALGTIPLMFGFGNIISSIQKSNIKKIMKISGLIVIVLGLFMFNRGLLQFGIGFKSLLPDNAISKPAYIVSDNAEEKQIINMDLTYRGYSPNVLYIKKGIPVKWIINVKEMSGCTNAIMIESLGIKKDLVKGVNVIEFTPPNNVREIKFSCWMRMVWGKFVITDSSGAVKGVSTAENDAADLPTSESCDGSCGGGCGQTTSGCGCGG